jgi:hypothetical protein
VRDVDADLAHRLDGSGVDALCGCGTAGDDIDIVAGQVLQPAGGHLRPAGVVDAQEHHGRLGAHG